tara:strand:+ start:13041 stop:14027 length:987 start_codon:yes stop_codon:yes gene_type:complete
MKNLDSNTLKETSPAGEIMAFHRGELCFHQSWGKTYKYYDLASLTKILFTNDLLQMAIKQKLLKLSDPVHRFLPYWHKGVKIENLLRHDAGYTWWKPFYRRLPLHAPIELKPAYLQKLIVQEKPVKSKQAVYSDIDYFILGFVLEKIFNMPLSYGYELLEHPFHFNVGNQAKYNKYFYAPTEKCSWRGKRLQGEVHDQNAWALGGVAPHAGLFGSIQDMRTWFLDFRLRLKRDAILKNFCRRAMPVSRGDWALGYMMPSKGKASCGSKFSLKSIGHTGFTGTSFWYDPEVDLGVIVLSNRIYRGANHKQIRKTRPWIHDHIYERCIHV